MNKSDIFKDLVFRISNGDAKAFGNFYDLFSQKVYQFSRYFIKSQEINEEIVADVFITIWHNREKLPGISNMEAYLYIVTRNKSYNYLDKEGRNPESASEIPVEIVLENSDPEKILITKEIEEAINTSIQELPERCRIIFLMSRQKSLTYNEIAKLLSISEKTVHAQMVTALKKLNTALRKYFYILF